MLSKELKIFSSIEACLTHRCSKVFLLPFKAPQNQCNIVKMKRYLKKVFSYAETRAENWAKQSF